MRSIFPIQEKGIGILNASPNGMGLLTERGPPDWHPATNDIKSECKKAADYCQVGCCIHTEYFFKQFG